MINLIRSELLKLRTVKTWWIFAIGLVVMTGLALWMNCAQAAGYLSEPTPDTTGMDPEYAQQMLAEYAAKSKAFVQATEIYTSGQYFGGLFLLLLGVLVVTNEFHHQTATATFLAAPVRSAVVSAKLVAGILLAGGFWLVTTAINLVVGVIFFHQLKLGAQLGVWEVQRAILFNLMVFALWAVLGVGFGALIRNQIGATLVAAVLYTFGAQVVSVVFYVVRQNLIKQDWVDTAQVTVPSMAAKVFTSPVEVFPHSPPYWVGGLVLLGYGLVSAAAGAGIMRIRDIS